MENYDRLSRVIKYWKDMRTTTYPEPPLNVPHRGTPATALTRGYEPRAPAAKYLYFGSMKLLPRDVQILKLVGRFGQLIGTHVDALVFPNHTADRPSRRSLKRLTEEGLLARVPGRVPGGELGGSPAHVYQVGPEGWRLYWSGKYRPMRAVNLHTLAIADAYVAAKREEQAGLLKVLYYATEPDSWICDDGIDVRPDIFLDIGIISTGRRRLTWLEVDLGTERQKQILEKVERYIYAYHHQDKLPLDAAPAVTFLTLDDERTRELTRMLRGVRDAPEGLFSVHHAREFPQVLM